MNFSRAGAPKAPLARVRNNQFDGCGISRFWQPGCIITGGSFNISVVNNGILTNFVICILFHKIDYENIIFRFD